MTPEIQRQNRTIGIIAAALLVIGILGSFLYATDTVKVTFVNGDGTEISGRTLEGFAPWYTPEPTEKENYTFIGWADQNGNMIPDSRIKPYEDLMLTAVYMVSLNTEDHVAYMPLKDGLFACADAALTRGDAALMLYALYEDEVSITRYYPDIRPESAYYEAAAALRALGVEDSVLWFKGEEPITRGELLGWLVQFFPLTAKTCTFADVSHADPLYEICCVAVSRGWMESGAEVTVDPDGTITRGEAAALMNRVLGRQAADGVSEKQVGIVPDLYEDHEYYGDLVEAAISHRYSYAADGTERRRNWDQIRSLGSGRVLVGTELYCTDETGHIVRNATVDGFTFDENGIYTSGMPELDALVQEVLQEIIEPGMTAEERLETVYDYTVSSFTYLRRNYYRVGATGFAEKEAYTMLSTGYGNCYCYASTFYHLSRALGEDAKIYAGLVEWQYPHGWVEFEIDGVRYVCDSELEMAIGKKGRKVDMYMMSPRQAAGWGYIR